MRREEPRRAIELPARRGAPVGRPGAVDVLVADVEGAPGVAAVSTTLLELWQRREVGVCA